MKKYLAFGLICSLAPLVSCSSNNKPAQQLAKPNIIYILADDLGYGDVSANNTQSKISTPNIDLLAEQGMRFTDAHSPSAVCTPTRYGIVANNTYRGEFIYENITIQNNIIHNA